MKKFLSVIIPSFNESQNLKRGALGAIEDYLKREKFEYEVIIVDDGSTDNSASLIEEEIKDKKSFKLIKNSHNGKAITVMTGLLSCEGEIALFVDMDQATPIREVEKILPKFNEGFDIVIGSRKGREGAPIIRKLMAFGFATLRNLLLGLPFTDTQCGFKAFNKKARDEVFPLLYKKWQNVPHGKAAAVNAGFDVEVLFLAKKRNLNIAEVVVDWHHVGTERVQVISDSIEAIGDMFKMRISEWRGKYN